MKQGGKDDEARKQRNHGIEQADDSCRRHQVLTLPDVTPVRDHRPHAEAERKERLPQRRWHGLWPNLREIGC